MKRGGRARADEVLAAALAAGRTVGESAKAAGVSEATAYRRLAVREFNERVRELRAEMVASAAGRLAEAMAAAALVLRKLLASPSEGVQLRAANSIIEQGLKVAQLTDLEGRMAAIEDALKAMGKDRGL